MKFKTIEEANKFLEDNPEIAEKVMQVFKEEENKKMLQEEQNLQEALNYWKSKRDDSYAKAKKIAEELDMVNAIAFEADENVGKLEKKLEEVHKKWIAANPAKDGINTAMPTQNASIIRQAFEPIWQSKFSMDDDYNMLFKRFDNLLHNRCKSTMMFGKIWNIDSVVDFLHGCNRSNLANKLVDYLNNNI